MKTITREVVEQNIELAKKEVEQARNEAHVLIGKAMGRLGLLEQQLAFFDEPEGDSAQADAMDAHPTLREARAVAEAAIS